MFSLIYTRIYSWVNTGEAGDLRRHHTHYDVIVMILIDNKLTWKQHIVYLSGKIYRGIEMSIKARQYLDKQMVDITLLFFLIS